MKKLIAALFTLFIAGTAVLAQGSWSPANADLTFPRTLADSLAIPAFRASLAAPERRALYLSVWNGANLAVPAGNATDGDRFTRSVIAREAAFVLLADRKPAGDSLAPLDPSDRDALRARVITLLEAANTTVEVGTFWTFYTPWQHRSKELIGYLIAYDLLKGAGVPPASLGVSKGRLLDFSANLYQRSMATYTFLNLKFFTYQFNNHSIMTASALGLAAVVFSENTSSNGNYQPQNWINAGLYNLDNTLWMENGTYPRVSEPDTLAGYAEGPNYFKYGFENAFPFLRAMGNFLPDGYYPATFNGITRTIRNPWHDDRFDRLYDWLNRIRMPDGGFPSIHDSYMGYGTVIMALSGKPQFNLPNPSFTYDEPWIRSQYLATGVSQGTITDSLFQALPAAGSLVFRSSWSTTAVYLHFIGKHGIALSGAKSHHQADASSFSLMAHGQLLAVDPGYPGASLADLTNKATDHSLILVNGAGPLVPTGELVSVSTNTCYIENFFDLPGLDFGEVRTAYQGADIVRRALFIRDSYPVLADFATAASPKTFTFQLHGNGLAGGSPASANGSFQPDYAGCRGVYTRGSVQLTAQVLATGADPSFSHETDSMVTDGGFRTYSKMLASRTNAASVAFLAVMYPSVGAAPAMARSAIGASKIAARVSTPEHRDLVFVSRDNQPVTIAADSSGFSKSVSGNALLSFVSETQQGSFSAAFMRHGDSLRSGGQTLVRASGRKDIAWLRIDSSLYCGFAADTGLFQLCAGGALQWLKGAAILTGYDSLAGLVTVHIPSVGRFWLGRNDLTWEWTGAISSDWCDSGNWRMHGHPGLNGVPQATNNVIIPAGTPHAPVVLSTQPAVCHDLTVMPGASLGIGSMEQLTVTGTLILMSEGTQPAPSRPD